MNATESNARPWSTADMPDRDLSFFDAVGTKTLTPQQRDTYNREGFCHSFEAFAGDNLTELRGYVDYLFELMRASGKHSSYALLGYHTRCRGLFDIVMNPKILDVVEDVIGPNIICWTSQVFCKVAHDPKSIPFHQDASYWPLSPARTVTAWLAIDDADVENSCLTVIPRTHRLGQLPWTRVSDNAVLDQSMDDPLSYGDPYPIELRAGQFSIHADMLAHGSTANHSARRRCGFAIRYCPPSVQPLKRDWSRNAILCRGTDTTGNWTYTDRPEGEDVGDWPSYWFAKYREAARNIREAGNIGA